MRHYAHNIGDYAAATAHLSFVEDAAYRRLLCRYYQDEKPLGSDAGLICRLVGASTKQERAAVLKILQEFFTLDETGYHQLRADREIAIYQEKVANSRTNGTKGGRPRIREQNPEKPTRDISQKPNHSPLTKKEEESLPKSDSLPARARHDRDDPGIERDIPEAEGAPDPATVKPFLRRHLTQQTVPPNWRPSTTAIQRLRGARPDMTDAQIAEETEKFLSWCADTGKTTFSPEDAWLNFARRSHVKPSDDLDPDDSPAARGIAAAIARRYPNG